MAKGRHAKDKLYQTPNELKENGLGYQGAREAGRMHFLAFNSCSLGLQEATTPVITQDGYLFHFDNINEFIKKYHKNPVTGAELSVSDLRAVRFTKNDAGAVCCPVTHRVFNHHSYILVNLKSGNVFSKDAIDEVCRSMNSWFDPVSDEPFDKDKDLIVLQNPSEPPKKINSKIFFDNKDLILGTKSLAINDQRPSLDPSVHVDDQGKRIKEMIEERKDDGLLAKHRELGLSRKVEPLENSAATSSALYSTGSLAASFTSTASTLTSVNVMRQMSDEEKRVKMYREVKSKKAKGYARIRTTLGSLSLLLHCDIAPRACHSFMLHAESGYYNGHKFHRILPSFVFQAGDPTGTGKGGVSAFENGVPFKEELDPLLNHVGRGILGMANSGPGTNGSQFYITFASCPHLDKKHTIFGSVVGGKEVIDKFENVKQKSGKPLNPPLIVQVEVFKNPFKETEFYKLIQKEKDKNLTVDPTEDLTVDDKKRPREEENAESKLRCDNDFVFGESVARSFQKTVRDIKRHRE
eukprot:GHVH01004310.1.p1 GENE.GHVH01004310.1~~GHVH01004310.1.p1  ORF type:complete len:523 (+),score=92.33 GHVH01004310.1:63-1631(+)